MIVGAFAIRFFGNSSSSDRPARTSFPSALLFDRPVDPDQPADAVQREPEPELDRRELRRDHDDEREALVPAGNFVSISPNAFTEMS